jgi:hypothetical protein
MMFQNQVKDAAQSYRCFDCADRWAIVLLYSNGGVSSIDYMNRSSKSKRMLAFSLAGMVGDALWNKKK